MPSRVSAGAKIPLPIETCWAKFRDLTRATDYVPGLTNTVITTEKKEGVGASRIVSHSRFGDMNETVTAWDDGVGMTIRLHNGDGPAKPFKEAEFRYEFRPSADTADACEIHTSLSYVLPGGAIGRLLDRLFLRRVFRKNIVDTAVCLAENYQTDQPIDPTRIKALRATALS